MLKRCQIFKSPGRERSAFTVMQECIRRVFRQLCIDVDLYRHAGSGTCARNNAIVITEKIKFFQIIARMKIWRIEACLKKQILLYRINERYRICQIQISFSFTVLFYINLKSIFP